jgi:hypothetical protein
MCSPAQGVVPIVLQRAVRLLAATVERKTSPKRNGARGVEYGVTTQAADVMISTMFYCGVERKKKSSRTMY